MKRNIKLFYRVLCSNFCWKEEDYDLVVEEHGAFIYARWVNWEWDDLEYELREYVVWRRYP